MNMRVEVTQVYENETEGGDATVSVSVNAHRKFVEKMSPTVSDRNGAGMGALIDEAEAIGLTGVLTTPKALRSESHHHLTVEQRQQIWDRFCEIQASGNGCETGYAGVEAGDVKVVAEIHKDDDIETLITIVDEWAQFGLDFDPDTGSSEPGYDD